MAREHRKKVSKSVRASVYIRDNWTCQYCGLKFTPEDGHVSGRYAPYENGIWLELDHIEPYSISLNNSADNLLAACTPCNRQKSTSTVAVDWPVRIKVAREILDSGPANSRTAAGAVEALTGARFKPGGPS